MNFFDSIQALWLLWLIIFVVFLLLSLILSYQWRHYAVQNSNLRFGEFIYYILAIFLLGFSALAIILFNSRLL